LAAAYAVANVVWYFEGSSKFTQVRFGTRSEGLCGIGGDWSGPFNNIQHKILTVSTWAVTNTPFFFGTPGYRSTSTPGYRKPG